MNDGAAGKWLRVRLRGRESNRDGIGAIIRTTTGEQKQMRVVTAGDGFGSQYSRVAHFGLAAAQRVDELTIDWPSGKRQTFTNVRANQLLDIDEYADELPPENIARKTGL